MPPAVPRLDRVEMAVLVAGICSMGLEILAGRIIAPVFGSSIYTWGAIIGVFLTALSLGYHRGGRSARNADVAVISHLFIAAAAFVAVVLLIDDALLAATAGLPLPSRFAPLIPVTVLFAPPVYLLGFISPYAAELSDRDGTGAASGHVYALGTIGSIAGSFATTFVLIPMLSIELIGILFGAALLAASIGLSWPALPGRTVTRTLAVGVLLAVAAAASTPGLAVPGEVIHATQTPYQGLQVVDDGDVRTLYLDGQRHSAMDRTDPSRHVFTYTRYFHLSQLMTDDIDTALFIGGGGFTGPKHFSRAYNVTVDAVEIDPVVVDVAERYFDVSRTDRLRIHTMDGRRYLRETNRTYDLIVLDAYTKDKVPFHLTTVEFMELVRGHLDADGVLIANLISAPSGSGSDFLRAEYRTMSRVFPQVHAFPTTDTGFVQNIILAASMSPDPLSRTDLERRNAERDIGIDLSDAISHHRGTIDTGDAPLLRDDRAPVDQLLDPLSGQRYTVQTTE